MSLLTSALLRRLAHPLRSSHPRLYAALNRVRKRLLSRGSSLDAYQAVALRRFLSRVDIQGARVLEVGSDLELRILRALVDAGARECVGINNSEPLWASRPSTTMVSGASTLVKGDAMDLEFPDGSFDHIFSVATFEHIRDLPRALDEMYRVLRPGGLLFASFGPIWSAGKGHHVRVFVGDQAAYHAKPELNPLPDFCHLLLAPDEMRGALDGRTSPVLIEPVVEWVYRAPNINRLHHHQYRKLFHESRLRLVSMGGEQDPISPQLRRILEFRYPDETAFDVTNIEVLLAKDAV